MNAGKWITGLRFCFGKYTRFVMMEQTDKISQLISPAVEALGYEVVRVAMQSSPRGGASTLQVMVERPDRTMTVEGCAQVSREISVILDVEDPIAAEYVLEVSSPGLDRPLTRKKDFVDFAGFEAKIEMKQAVSDRRRYRGMLGGMAEDDVLITVDGEEYKLDFDSIHRAKLVLTDALLTAAG